MPSKSSVSTLMIYSVIKPTKSKNASVVRQIFGYTHIPQKWAPAIVTAAVRAEDFSDESFARYFISKLDVEDEHWRKILQQANLRTKRELRLRGQILT